MSESNQPAQVGSTAGLGLEPEREDFEAHAKATGVCKAALARWPGGEYVSPLVEAEWRGFYTGRAVERARWKAALAQGQGVGFGVNPRA